MHFTQMYIGRQQRSSVAWLETHVWHAKRCHMRIAWSLKVARQSTLRSHRATTRDIQRQVCVCVLANYAFSCTSQSLQVAVHDMSYVFPYELRIKCTDDEDKAAIGKRIIEGLARLGICPLRGPSALHTNGHAPLCATMYRCDTLQRVCPIECHWV